MKKLALIFLLLASCRSARVDTVSVVHDTVTVSHAAAVDMVARDTVVVASHRDAVIERATIDTAGRVRTVTRIITRTVTDATRGTTTAAAVHDTVYVTRASTSATHSTTSPPPSRSTWLPAIALAVIALVLALRPHRR